MRIVIDLQSLQTPGSRHRGIGRYSLSLAKAMLTLGKSHEFHLLLNGTFSDTVSQIRRELAPLLPQDQFHVFSMVQPTAAVDPQNDDRRLASELTREAFIANLNPDFVHITSHFEGHIDDSISSIGRCGLTVPVGVTVYDLIPLIHESVYLRDAASKRWYQDRLLHLRRADLLLAISESTAREVRDYLGFSADQVVNVGADADPQFNNSPVDSSIVRRAHRRLGITRPFVMYTGGIDWRKNIERLIGCYAQLAAPVRRDHQLVIVCSVDAAQKHTLLHLAAAHGLAEDELIVTGFVPETDLVTLYKTCRLFVFPSWHEGFGLPALEAMRCGAPVIGGNRSSLPEVIGCASALFDPFNENDITERIRQGLVEEEFRRSLLRHQRDHIKTFSWDNTALTSISAIERCVKNRRLERIHATSHPTKLRRLAFVSPLPPSRTGIADYSAELLPELSAYYDIEVIVENDDSVGLDAASSGLNSLPVRTIEWMKRNSERFDRILYHLGNSPHHTYMLNAVGELPGVIVLHDFFLSGFLSFEQYQNGRGDIWLQAAYNAHGYSALAFQHRTGVTDAVLRYPGNRTLVAGALDVIVHSEFSREMGRAWVGTEAERWPVIPHLRKPAETIDRQGARERLGFAETDIVVSSFGFVGRSKQSDRIFSAWLSSGLAAKGVKLVFVGANSPDDYGAQLLDSINSAGVGESVRIVGWTEQAEFRDYLAASDVAVQLRACSRGETSGTVLDAMNFGLATIVNAHGAMAELPQSSVHMLPDDFTQDELAEALVKIATDEAYRSRLGGAAERFIKAEHSPRTCAKKYAEAIERAYENDASTTSGIIERLRDVPLHSWPVVDLINLSSAIQLATGRAPPTSYFDVSNVIDSLGTRYTDLDLISMLRGVFSQDLPRRLEPIYWDMKNQIWRFARTATLHVLGMPVPSLADDPVSFAGPSDLISLGKRRSLANRRSGLHALAHWTLVKSEQAPESDRWEHPLAPVMLDYGWRITPDESAH